MSVEFERVPIDRRVQLEFAIKQLYETFSVYESNELIKGCDCCHTEDEIRVLSNNKNEIPAGFLRAFGFEAMSSWGDVTDFKRLLPKLFEYTAWDDTEHVNNVDMFIEKLREASWKMWPPNEQSAVENFLSAFLFFAATRNSWQVNEIVAGMVECEFDFALVLTKELSGDPSLETTLLICALISAFTYTFSSLRWRKNALRCRLPIWFTDNAIEQRLQDSFFLLMDKDTVTAARISKSLDQLSWMNSLAH